MGLWNLFFVILGTAFAIWLVYAIIDTTKKHNSDMEGKRLHMNKKDRLVRRFTRRK